MYPQVLWSISFIFIIYSVFVLLENGWSGVFSKSEIETLVTVRRQIQDFQEKVLCGIFPDDEDWEALRGLQDPWGGTIYGILISLRQKGASIAPTLNRLKDLAMKQEESIRDGKAKAAAAIGQATLILCILPALSALLYLLVPGLEDQTLVWIAVSFFSIALAAFGVYWVSRYTEEARFGGLKKSERVWILDASLFLEKLTGFIQAGNAPDLVWAQAYRDLPAELAARWGAILWKLPDDGDLATQESKSLRDTILNLGIETRRSLQMSLYEGRPALDALETLSRAFQHEVSAFQERELQKLPIRTLKPLFMTVAPGAFLMLGVSVAILVGEVFDSGGGF